MTNNVHLRNVDNATMRKLKLEAKMKNTSVNQLILMLLKQGLGIAHKKSNIAYHDMDHLAGSWNDADTTQFLKNTQDFEKIDEDFWK